MTVAAPIPFRSPLTSSLAGETVVISGGTSGIGLAAGTLLRSIGARVVLIGRDQERLQSAVAHVRNTVPSDDAGVLGVAGDGADLAAEDALPLGDHDGGEAVADHVGQRGLVLRQHGATVVIGIRIGVCVEINNQIVIGDQVHLYAHFGHIHTVDPGHGRIDGGHGQGDGSSVESSVFARASQGEAVFAAFAAVSRQ